MAPKRRPQVSSDWVLRATWYEIDLSTDSPIVPSVSVHPDPTTLRIDMHEGFEVGILLDGREERHYPECVMPLQPGDVWLQPMWEPHGWRVTKADTQCVVLVFLPEFLGNEVVGEVPWLSLFAVPPQDRMWVRDDATRAAALSVGRELAGEIEERRRSWQAAIRLGLLRLLFTLGRDWDPPADGSETWQARTSSLSRVIPAVSLMKQRGPGAVNTEDAAAACGLSRSRFGTLFREAMGTSFGQFALRARLAFAAHRLLTTDASAEVIGRQVGFVDGSHFHRAFRKRYGCSPHAYRARQAAEDRP
jgi:AraC-like DNA-binding protein